MENERDSALGMGNERDSAEVWGMSGIQLRYGE